MHFTPCYIIHNAQRINFLIRTNSIGINLDVNFILQKNTNIFVGNLNINPFLTKKGAEIGRKP